MTQTDPFIYEKLGLRPRIADRFYARDLVNFYKDQVHLFSEKEEPYFARSLSLFVEFLENQRAGEWETCDLEIWRKLFAFSYLDLAYEQSPEQTAVFFKTMRAFAKWLDEQYTSLNVNSEVEPLTHEFENVVQEAVQFLDAYQQKVENPFLTGYEEVRRETLLQEVSDHTLSEGVFEAEALTEDGARFKSLLNNQFYDVHLPAAVRENLKAETSLIGVLKESSNNWEILVLDRVFPPQALPYLKQAIGVA